MDLLALFERLVQRALGIEPNDDPSAIRLGNTRPDADAWALYAADLRTAMLAHRAGTLSFATCDRVIHALPEGASADVSCEVVNLLYEEPANPAPLDPDLIGHVTRCLADDPDYETFCARIEAMWQWA